MIEVGHIARNELGVVEAGYRRDHRVVSTSIISVLNFNNRCHSGPLPYDDRRERASIQNSST